MIVDQIDLQYADIGQGPAVLLLHGWGTSLETFGSLLAAGWGSDKRCIVLDLPGFGGSEAPVVAWDVAAYAKLVRSFLDKLAIEQPQIVVGHSLGGRIAIKGVAQGQFKPQRLVLIAAAGAARSRTLRKLVFLLMAKFGKMILAIPPLSLLQEKLRDKLYAMAGSNDYLNAGNMRGTFLKISQENLIADARTINVPTLLVWGEQDTITPLQEARALQTAIAGSQLVVIPQAGHFVHKKNPSAVAAAIVDFTNPTL